MFPTDLKTNEMPEMLPFLWNTINKKTTIFDQFLDFKHCSLNCISLLPLITYFIIVWICI